MRIKICRKEAKESRLWLRHLLVYEQVSLEPLRMQLIQESVELEKIFGAILKKLG